MAESPKNMLREMALLRKNQTLPEREKYFRNSPRRRWKRSQSLSRRTLKMCGDMMSRYVEKTPKSNKKDVTKIQPKKKTRKDILRFPKTKTNKYAATNQAKINLPGSEVPMKHDWEFDTVNIRREQQDENHKKRNGQTPTQKQIQQHRVQNQIRKKGLQSWRIPNLWKMRGRDLKIQVETVRNHDSLGEDLRKMGL